MTPKLSNRSAGARRVFALPPALLNALYPPRCAGCDAFCEPLFCAPCRATLQISPPIPRVRETPFETSTAREYSLVVPERSREQGAAFQLETRAALLFDGALREALHRFKYEGRTALAAPFAQLMLEMLRATEKETASTRALFPAARGAEKDVLRFGADISQSQENLASSQNAQTSASTRAPSSENAAPIFVPIPLHAWRKWRRGFNQSELLARELARFGNATCVSLLRRARYTATQTELSREERTENVRGAFALSKSAARVLAKHDAREIVLIDDVFTTGATLHEAARILHAAFPAAKISALTLAFQPPH